MHITKPKKKSHICPWNGEQSKFTLNSQIDLLTSSKTQSQGRVHGHRGLVSSKHIINFAMLRSCQAQLFIFFKKKRGKASAFKKAESTTLH